VCVFIERERVVYGIGFTTLLGIDVDMIGYVDM
jgi:hypothetical protein